MLWWDKQFLIIIKEAGINVTLYKRFVDDSNIKAVAIDLNKNRDPQRKRLINVEPVDDPIPTDKHTALVVQQIANSVTSMLRFTADFPSNHQNGKMPVLDICMWTTETESGTLSSYELYSKPMANAVSISANSAISHNIKLSTYRQIAFRVLMNLSLIHI